MSHPKLGSGNRFATIAGRTQNGDQRMARLYRTPSRNCGRRSIESVDLDSSLAPPRVAQPARGTGRLHARSLAAEIRSACVATTLSRRVVNRRSIVRSGRRRENPARPCKRCAVRNTRAWPSTLTCRGLRVRDRLPRTTVPPRYFRSPRRMRLSLTALRSAPCERGCTFATGARFHRVRARV